jgi:putative ABC transport system substrate-binding protein
LQRATRTVPIVFALVSDPVGTGYVESLARPGGNTTGFTLFEYTTSGKYLELLKEVAPGVKRAAVIRESGTATGTGQFAAIQAVALALGVELSPIGVSNADEIERALAAFARAPNGGLVVTGSAPAAVHSDLIVTLAARHKLPADVEEDGLLLSVGFLAAIILFGLGSAAVLGTIIGAVLIST